jgi:aspartate/methionine/tyrosine aminotransferase
MSRRASRVAARIRTAVFADLQKHIDRVTASGSELLPLHIGDTHIAPPPRARAALAQLDPDDATLYRYGQTTGLASLREAMAATLRERGVSRDPATEILVGNGGTHALYCSARAVLDEGDEVLLASPYWPLAPGVFTATGAVPVEVPLTQRLYDDPSLDPAELLREKLTEHTRALYFISPNNPDGKVLDRAQLERIASFACEHDLWVFSDEVYASTAFLDRGAPSIAALTGMLERTITLHSLSKSHALAGLRVGFTSAPESLVATGRRVSTHTAFNVSVAMQRAAEAALADATFPAVACADYRAARDACVGALDGAKLRFHVAEGATYLFLDFAPAIAAAGVPADRALYAILERAIDRGVLLAPGDAFGSGYGSFARLCFSSVALPSVLKGIERLREAVDDFVASP